MLRGLLLICAAFAGVSVAATVCLANVTSFSASLTMPTTKWDHYWERCMGSCHATTALRADWRQQIKWAHDKLGIQQVRFHGLFDDDMSVYQRAGDGSPIYSFYNIDNIYDFLLSIGMKPYVELSFMPEDMASGTATIFHYKGNITPPKNYSDWEALLKAFAQHLIDRYGIAEVSQWYFEVWNEPNCGFFDGTMQDYFLMLQNTVAALKSVNSKIKVGGPSTCQSDWITQTIQFVKTNNVQLDFISTHEYPTDPNAVQDRDGFAEVIAATAKLAGDYPLIYSEYNDGLWADSLHDNIYAASMIVKTIPDVAGLVEVLSWWTFTDIFEEGGLNSVPFNQGFGVQTIINVMKPSFRAFELLHATGTDRVYVTPYPEGTVDILVTTNSTHMVILATNFNYKDAPITTKAICIQVSGYTGPTSPTGLLFVIDDTHANPYDLWVKMGRPTYPTQQQIQLLQVASEMQVTLFSPKQDGTTLGINLTLTPYEVAAIVLPL